MAQVENANPIQDPQVFARCFRRAHFATKVLEDIFRQSVSNITATSTGLFEYERIDGDMGYTIHIGDVKFNGLAGSSATVLVQKDFSNVCHLTARQVDCNFHPDTTNEPVYIITFVDSLPVLPHTGPVLKFTMQDIVAHKLCDMRWEYFICCSHADEITQPFLRDLCKLLRGEECKTDDALVIKDTAWGVAAEIAMEKENAERQYQEEYGTSMPGFEEQAAEGPQMPTVVDDGENVAEPAPEVLAQNEAIEKQAEQEQAAQAEQAESGEGDGHTEEETGGAEQPAE